MGLLEKLKVEPTRKARFKTINRDIVERVIGHVFVEYGRKIAPKTVAFAQERFTSLRFARS